MTTTRDEPVYIRVEDEHILGTLITPGTLLPGVLFVHGWGGDQQQYVSRARELAALGCACVTFDLRGHAQTQAQFESVSREDSMRDVLAAYDSSRRSTPWIRIPLRWWAAATAATWLPY